MDTNRRDALKLGASAALSSMLISNAVAASENQPPIVVELLSGKAGFRIANYLPRMGCYISIRFSHQRWHGDRYPC